ncbi:helix-turn-helix domain-containing protein [Pseudomonas sp. D1-36]|uniref:helix-turn-helix domain-containing protein n=1 Tax=Pseudomonas sp. D1-36 TaxID=2817387 RepID=UPI003DAA0FAC
MTNPDILRKFQGVWIPAELWKDRTLSITEKVMLVEIGSLEDDERGCYASNAKFAEFFDLSISRVSEIISGLAEKRLVSVEQIRDGVRVVERRIRLIHPFGKPNTPSENTSNPFGKDGEPPSENTQGSNTLLSNTLRVIKTPSATAPGNGKKAAGKPRTSKFDPLSAKPANVSADAWAGFCEMRKAKRAPLTLRACEQIAKKLANHPDPDAVLDKSTTSSWSDIYPDSVLPGAGAKNGKQSRHTNLDQINHEDGLERQSDGTYRIASVTP